MREECHLLCSSFLMQIEQFISKRMERSRVISALCIFVSCNPKIWLSPLWIAQFDETKAYVKSKLLHYLHTLRPAVRWHYYVEPLSVNCVPPSTRLVVFQYFPFLLPPYTIEWEREPSSAKTHGGKTSPWRNGNRHLREERVEEGGESGSRVLQCVWEWGSGYEIRDGDYNGWENLVECGHTSITFSIDSLYSNRCFAMLTQLLV